MQVVTFVNQCPTFAYIRVCYVQAKYWKRGLGMWLSTATNLPLATKECQTKWYSSYKDLDGFEGLMKLPFTLKVFLIARACHVFCVTHFLARPFHICNSILNISL